MGEVSGPAHPGFPSPCYILWWNCTSRTGSDLDLLTHDTDVEFMLLGSRVDAERRNPKPEVVAANTGNVVVDVAESAGSHVTLGEVRRHRPRVVGIKQTLDLSVERRFDNVIANVDRLIAVHSFNWILAMMSARFGSTKHFVSSLTFILKKNGAKMSHLSNTVRN